MIGMGGFNRGLTLDHLLDHMVDLGRGLGMRIPQPAPSRPRQQHYPAQRAPVFNFERRSADPALESWTP
jgi:hypothetical protein